MEAINTGHLITVLNSLEPTSELHRTLSEAINFIEPAQNAVVALQQLTDVFTDANDADNIGAKQEYVIAKIALSKVTGKLQHEYKDEFELDFDIEPVEKVEDARGLFALDLRDGSDSYIDESVSDYRIENMIDSGDFLFGTEK